MLERRIQLDEAWTQSEHPSNNIDLKQIGKQHDARFTLKHFLILALPLASRGEVWRGGIKSNRGRAKALIK